MTLKIGQGLTALWLLTMCEYIPAAMVLPRPPLSPNEIPRQNIRGDYEKFNNERTIYSLVQLNTNVEKPNTDGYRLLEIELRGGDDVNESNIQGLVRAMLATDEEPQKRNPDINDPGESIPNPEIIPRSILGVRDIGLSSNYRTNPFVVDKRKLLDRSADRGPNDKLYYLKNNRPKVDVNVRGHSGSFTSDRITSTMINDRYNDERSSAIDYDRSIDAKKFLNKINRAPKKYLSATSQRYESDDYNDDSTGNYEPRPDRANEESTTENMSVTSSELPKQIPAPPSVVPSQVLVAPTTPIQRYGFHRTDLAPGYRFDEA